MAEIDKMGGGPVSRKSTMPSFSVLFDTPRMAARDEHPRQPGCFGDLNLDQVFSAMVDGRKEYDLQPLYFRHLDESNTIRYRQDVFRDLEDDQVRGAIAAFGEAMRAMRADLDQARKLRSRYQQGAWFLNAVDTYCGALRALAASLAETAVHSQGLRSLQNYLRYYLDSDAFTTLLAETRQVDEQLSRVQYCVRIKGARVVVTRYDDEDDYGAAVVQTFERFQQSAARDYRVRFEDAPEMNHVEERVLELVARLFEDVFSDLDAFVGRHSGYLDQTMTTFDREAQFYLAYIDHIAPLKAAGLPFCYPEIADRAKAMGATETFDLALAARLIAQRETVIVNDVYLDGPERMLVVSGPNQGGKTTLARTFGQLHHLGSLGMPVPGRTAHLGLFDRIFTHFEREEDLSELSGKLEDDLTRMQLIFRDATPDSIVIINEIFTSTTLHDAVFLGAQTLERIIELDLRGVYVTFVDELATLSPATVSMVSTVEADDPTRRTFKVVRKPPEGLAYALALADKHGLTRQALKAKISA